MGRGVVLGFWVAVAYWPWVLPAAVLPREAVVAVGVPLLCRVDVREVDSRVWWLLVFGVAWALGSARGMEAGFWLLVLAVAFVAGAGLRSLDGVMTGLALGIAVSSVLCVAQLFGWQGVRQASMPAGLFFSREVLAEFAAPVAVWWVIRAVGRPAFESIVFAFAASLPLVLCGERAAIFAAACGGWYYVFCGRVPRGRTDLGWRIAVALGILLIAGIFSLFFLDPSRSASAAMRVETWRLAARAIVPFGHGLGWFRAAYPYFDVAHSDLLQMLAELGGGAVFFLAIPVLCFVERRGSDAERAVLATICVAGMVSFLFEMPAQGFVAATVAGYLGGRRRGVCRGAPDGVGRGGAVVLGRDDGTDGGERAGGEGGRYLSL